MFSLSITSCIAAETTWQSLYNAVFAKLGLQTSAKSVVVEIESSSDRNLTAKGIKKILPGIDASTAIDYVKNNGTRKDLSAHLPVHPNLIQIARAELHRQTYDVRMFSWNKFHNKFPNSKGIIQLSYAGISSDGTEAVITIDYKCGHRCGRGTIALLVLENKQWKVKHWKRTWIS